MNLADLSSLLKYKVKYKYLLNVIDMFSHFVWSVLPKDKTGTSITAVLKALFKNRKTITIQSEKGTEFANATLQLYFKGQR